MAIRNFLCLAFALSLAACQSTPPRQDSVGARPEASRGVPAPPVLEDTSHVPPPPVPQPEEKKRVAVILGPGGAKAFAHVGVLKAFQQQRIPVEKVVGLEWGSLIGGLYALKGQVHDVEWKLYKMEHKNTLEARGFFGRRDGEPGISVLEDFLRDSFGDADVARAKVPFVCPSRSVCTGVVTWQTRGPFRDVMKRCMPFPPTLKAQGTFIAGASQAQEAVDQLVKEGFNVVILVNVLGSAMPVAEDGLRENLNYVILWQEVKRALAEASRLNIDAIQVDTSAYPMNQYGAKKELISLGENAGAQAARELILKYRF